MNTILQSDIFQINANLPWENVGPGLQRQIFGYNEQVMMVKVKFEKDAIGTLHSHPHIQTTYVASGIFEATIGDKKQLLKAGDGFFVPADIVHGVVCHEAGLLIDVFAPHREDFLK